MYEIYINEARLILSKPENLYKFDREDKGILIAAYSGKHSTLYNYIDSLEKGSASFHTIVLHHRNYNQLKADVKSIFSVIKAAGGLVVNEHNEILFIFRRGHWDLPKGKLEKGEQKKEGAIREVEEETGVKYLSLEGKLLRSKHVYRNKSGDRILKITTWYLMRAPKMQLIPQLEEDIIKAEWKTLETFRSEIRPVFMSILDVLNAFEGYTQKQFV